MKTGIRRRLLLPLFVLLFSFAFTANSEAIVLIYKVTFTGKARFFPRGGNFGNSFVHRGYLIYDTANPGQASTVEVFRNKTFEVNGGMVGDISPAAITFFGLDRNSDTFSEVQAGRMGFTNGNLTVSRSYAGGIPRAGIRFGNSVPITGVARAIRGIGSVTFVGTDIWRTSDVWRLLPLTAGNAANTSTGITAVSTLLVQRGYSPAP